MNENVVHLQSSLGQVAPLANIGMMEDAIDRLKNRGPGDPGIVVFSGYSGYGKSMAAAWAKGRHRAYYLQLDDFVTKKGLLVNLCKTLSLCDPDKAPKGTTAELADKVGAELAGSRRVLIIDEFDFAVDKNLVMSVFSIYEKSKASIILIGEEALPGKLAAGWEKFSGRVLETFYASGIGLEDAQTLARHKYPEFPFAEDLLAHLVEIAKGSVRRVNNNLATIYNTGLSMGWERCDAAMWGDRKLQQADVKRRGA
ncbi:AAA family ATPase [Propionivibrio sp.]|uniref:AAA family ATPase n=1 Tax=Propionivibrio sp. TaxID=2212460 RepID=UPI003BF08730